MRSFDEPEWLAIRDAADVRSFLLALVLLTVCIGLLAFAPGWRLYALAPERALGQDRIRVMHRLATDFAARPPDVLVVGGSQMRELLPVDAYIERTLGDACGRPVGVFNAASSSQPLDASIDLVEHFAAERPELVLFAVNPSRLYHGEPDAGALLPLPTTPAWPRFEALWADLGSLRDGSLRIPRTPLGPHLGAQHHYRGMPWDAARKRADAVQEVALAQSAGETVRARNVERLLDTDYGGAVLFVIPPHSPEADAPYRDYADAMARSLARLSDRGDILDLRGAPLTSADFHDAVHLRQSGRERIWPALLSALRGVLPGCAR